MQIITRMSLLKVPGLLLRTQYFSPIFITKLPFSDKKSDEQKQQPTTEPNSSKSQAKSDKKDAASKRLSDLLASMPTESDLMKLDPLSPPKAKPRKKTKETVDDPTNIITAVRNVAAELGADPKQTEIDLLSKLLNASSNDGDALMEKKTDKKSAENLSLSDLITGMKIDKPDVENLNSRAEFVRKTLQNQVGKNYSYQPNDRPNEYRQQKFRDNSRQERQTTPISVNLFGEEPLGIFTNITFDPTPNESDIWNTLQERELRLAVMHPPSNYFQKMMLWTAQGKLWKFPIDNEQGLDEEARISFTEHIFLDKHLDPWCPKKGPLRHFMELVCVGLSKNPYYTVQQKREHIDWFRNYFEEKKQILQNVVMDSNAAAGPSSTKTLSQTDGNDKA